MDLKGNLINALSTTILKCLQILKSFVRFCSLPTITTNVFIYIELIKERASYEN